MNNIEQAKNLFLEGLKLFAAADFSAAESRLRQAIQLAPDRPSVLTNLSACLLKQGKLEEAENLSRKAIHLDQENAEAWLNLGGVLQKRMQAKEALTCYDRAIAIRHDYAEAWSNRGAALNDLNRHDEALASLDRALLLNPENAEAWLNLGVTYQFKMRQDDALKSYERAKELNPAYTDAVYNAGLIKLSRHEYKLGWKCFAFRWGNKTHTGTLGGRKYQTLPDFLLKGSAGRTLVWCEAGIGDKIFFGTMLPEFQAIQKKFIVVTDVRLISLFSRRFPSIDFVPPVDISELLDRYPDLDSQLAIADMGRLVRNDLSEFPDRLFYLSADPANTERIRQKNSLEQGRRIIGVSWKSKNKEFGTNKTIALHDLLPIIEREPEAIFVNLQYGDVAEELARFEDMTGKVVLSLKDVDLYNNMEDLASAVDMCDLVVTCSNVTAHMAGAIGKRALVLLPEGKGKIWYWGESGKTTPWYPALRLFRQEQPGDWSKTIDSCSHWLGSNTN